MVTDSLNTGDNPTREKWFDDMVAQLRYDQTLIENDIMSKEKREMYDAMIKHDSELLHDYARRSSSVFFITKMVETYLKELVKSKSKPTNLALELSSSKILVWAEIKEDDEEMEDALILTEAKTNAMFARHGFHISSTIVEDTDGLQVPEQYKNVAIA